MALRQELKDAEKNCIELQDYIELANKALEEPKDIEYAKEILFKAEDECKFPDEFVILAEAFSKINETKKAEELYESAEENAFEPLEFARIAHSIYLTLNLKDKAIELYQNSIKEAKKSQELLEILLFIHKDFPESDIYHSILSKISSQIKSIEELTKILNEILRKDIDLAKDIAKKFEKNITGIPNLCKFAEIVFELFSDKHWAISIIEECNEDAKFTKEFILLAKAYQKIGETERVPDLLSQAKDYATNSDELYEVAIAIWDLKKDRDETSTLLQKSYKSIKDKNQLKNLIKFVKEELQNYELSKNIIEFLLENSNTNEELLNNILLGHEILKDSNTTEENFLRAMSKIQEPKDLILFGLNFKNITEQKEKVKIFFEKAFDNSIKFEHFVEVAKNYQKEFGKDGFLEKCLINAEEKSNTTTEFLELSKIYFDLLNDTNKAKECLQKAEEVVTSLQDMKLVNELAKKFFYEDENWILEIEEKLKKRESNQQKYDEFLKLEKEAKYLRDLLFLVDKAITDLDDIYYAKKLLRKANELIDKQNLNIENYYLLCKKIVETTKDVNWVIAVLDSLFYNRIRFIYEIHQLLDYVKVLFEDKEIAKSITEKYLNVWQRKVFEPQDTVRFAKLLFYYNFPTHEIESFLDSRFKEENNFQNLLMLLEFCLDKHLPNLASKVENKIWNSTQNSNEFLSLILTLKKYGYSEEILRSKFVEYFNKISKLKEVIIFLENSPQILYYKDLVELIKLAETKFRMHKELFENIRKIILEQKYW
ncbi:MAG: hypothetical protein N2560_03305 [Ignavibacteria bacterium]|nr:hypothetical protein [Ignavibacteria bacterium]